MMTERAGAPRVLPRGDWSRRLHAPYRIFVAEPFDYPGEYTDPCLSLESALLAFHELPPRRDVAEVIVDRDNWIVYGYASPAKFWTHWGHPAWVGSELGFSMVEALGLVHPVELAFRETVARAASDGDDWWKGDGDGN